MSSSFLESTLLTACPSFRADWAVLRGAWAREQAPSTAHFLASLRVHVLGRLRQGDAATFTRLAHTVERLLGDSDPILEGLLADHLVAPLAVDVRVVGIARALVEPHLGARTRAIWDAHASDA